LLQEYPGFDISWLRVTLENERKNVQTTGLSPLLTRHTSEKSRTFTESVIREMTREALKHGAVNLAQGFPDFPAPAAVKDAAIRAISEDVNQYAITWGAKPFRDAIAKKTAWYLGVEIDPEREITVTCGATEGMIATLLATVDPGDEVVIFEPFYENYGPDAILSGATPRFVQLDSATGTFDPEELARAFTSRTKAVIVCNPNNPLGKVFSRGELEQIAALCIEHDAIAITDEIYEHILYDREDGTEVEHVSMLAVDGMRDRCVVVNSLSKTYSVTGWRVGYCIASPVLTDAIRKVHDFLTVGAAAPLQAAGAFAMGLPESYYRELRTHYRARRDRLLPALERTGFAVVRPAGAYYVMADISNFGFESDVAFAAYLARDIGVACVPGSSFYRGSEEGAQLVRFCFCKKEETLNAAVERLARLG
jgi:aspartate/methionine/tyrosine aminotransferase